VSDINLHIGIVGTIASFTLGQWNNIVGICAGLCTIAWFVYKFVKENK
jgi:hypothetical protein